jgi:Lar family restriction alleviation protein
MTASPCPFCGGSSRLCSSLRDGHDDARAFYYTCDSCAAVGGWAKSETAAIRMWNMRPPEPKAPNRRPGSSAGIYCAHEGCTETLALELYRDTCSRAHDHGAAHARAGLARDLARARRGRGLPRLAFVPLDVSLSDARDFAGARVQALLAALPRVLVVSAVNRPSKYKPTRRAGVLDRGCRSRPSTGRASTITQATAATAQRRSNGTRLGRQPTEQVRSRFLLRDQST